MEPHEIDNSIEEEEAYEPPLETEDDEDAAQEWTHFGGGSNYDIRSNSTILDAEIL